MKTALFLFGGVLVTSILFMSDAASIYHYDDSLPYNDGGYEDFLGTSNNTDCNGTTCYNYPWPFPV